MLALHQRIASDVAQAAGRPQLVGWRSPRVINAIQPDFAEAYATLAIVHLQFLFNGPFSPRETVHHVEAVRKALQLDHTLVQAHHHARFEAYLGYAYAAAGRTADARGVLRELEAHRREQYVSGFGVALIHDALGEPEPALAALERAYEDRAVEFGQLAQYPPFSAIASQPRFQTVMRNVGLPR